MDIIVTAEGKRQAAQGNLRIKYATFTDRHTFYQQDPDDPSIAEDHSNRIFFEAVAKDQDRIIVETDAILEIEGSPDRILPFRGKDFQVVQGTIVTGSVSTISSGRKFSPYIPGQLTGSVILSGSHIPQKSDEILETITRHFSDQMIIGDRDPFSDGAGFELTIIPGPKGTGRNREIIGYTSEGGAPIYKTTPTFDVSDFFPFNFADSDVGKEGTMESSESFFIDRKLQHLPNFKFLPPVNQLLPEERVPSQLGSYPNVQQQGLGTIQDLEASLENKPYIDIDFTVTSRDNNIISQVFEFGTDNKVRKLSIIDYGEFVDQDPLSPGKRVYFVGKIYKDMYGALTFINMFTIVFD
jgi:hypothetical protein